MLQILPLFKSCVSFAGDGTQQDDPFYSLYSYAEQVITELASV